MKTILLIEDDAGFRKMLRTAFVIDGFSVREAANGYDALTLLDQQAFDGVVLDLGLPLVDGLSVLADINQKTPAYNITEPGPSRPALVVVTGSNHVEADDLDVDSLLRKPVTADHVVATVRKYLRQ